MPLPKKENGETEKEFISRCMGDKIKFPDKSQRYAICTSLGEK